MLLHTAAASLVVSLNDEIVSAPNKFRAWLLIVTFVSPLAIFSIHIPF
jgi:hypothetical protein